MNNKRQTIWLVSMLSLMVVLSAYYLFTEDVNDFEVQTPETVLNDIEVEREYLSEAQTDAEGVESNSAEVSGQASGKSNETNGSASDATSSLAAQQTNSSADYFTTQQLKRTEELSKQTEKLMTIITDSKQNTEAVSKAYDELNAIQEMEAKVTGVEEQLMKEFANAIVTEEASKWKVVVQADKLEKSQAVSIVDLVINELEVGPENITVQYMK